MFTNYGCCSEDVQRGCEVSVFDAGTDSCVDTQFPDCFCGGPVLKAIGRIYVFYRLDMC